MIDLEAIRARDADYNDVFEAQASMSKDIAHRLVAWPVADRRALLAAYDALAAENAALRARLAEAAQTEERLRRGLQFYADGSHYDFGDPVDWDSVSGEPSNFLCDEHGSTIEDGSVAKRFLEGADIGPDDDGEFVFIDAPRPADSAAHRETHAAYDALAAENAALKAQLAYAASTGDECAIEVESLRSRLLDAKEQVAALESREVCTVAHDNVETCGYCQRDELLAERALIVARAENAERALEEADERHGRYVKAVGELAGMAARLAEAESRLNLADAEITMLRHFNAEADALLRDAQTYAIDIQDFVLESGYKAAAVECADRIDAYLSRKEQP